MVKKRSVAVISNVNSNNNIMSSHRNEIISEQVSVEETFDHHVIGNILKEEIEKSHNLRRQTSDISDFRLLVINTNR